jgi:hypothetical protein
MIKVRSEGDAAGILAARELAHRFSLRAFCRMSELKLRPPKQQGEGAASQRMNKDAIVILSAAFARRISPIAGWSDEERFFVRRGGLRMTANQAFSVSCGSVTHKDQAEEQCLKL